MVYLRTIRANFTKIDAENQKGVSSLAGGRGREKFQTARSAGALKAPSRRAALVDTRGECPSLACKGGREGFTSLVGWRGRS